MKLTVLLVATIVAGEVGSTVPAARLPVACTVVEDHRRSRDLDRRWYGRGVPTDADVAAARAALEGACDHLPYFRFLGSDRDHATWIRLGFISPDDDVWTWSCRGWTVLGVPEGTAGVPEQRTAGVAQEETKCADQGPSTPEPSASSSLSPWRPPLSSPSFSTAGTSQPETTGRLRETIR